MKKVILFFLSFCIFPETYYNDDNKPPGFYRISKQDNVITYTSVSTAMSGGRVLHNGEDITAFDLKATSLPSKQMNTVLRQRMCGACWAFADSDVAGAAMFFNSMGSSEPVDTVMSPQYLLNCFTAHKNFETVYEPEPCHSGYSYFAMQDIMESGIVENDCFPYEEKGDVCVDTCTNQSHGFKKFIDKTLDVYQAYHLTDLAFLRQLVVTSGPVNARMKNYADFATYTDGIYEHNPNLTNPSDHAVVIYGFGVEGGKNYWLGKNSFGTNWGMNGWFKIRMGTNESGIEQRFIIINNNFNTSRPRPGVRIPNPQPTSGPGWNCSTEDPLYPNCNASPIPDYITDGSPYIPPSPPSDMDFSTPSNELTATHYYVKPSGAAGDCLSENTPCNVSVAFGKDVASKILTLAAGTYVPGRFTVAPGKYLSFIGNGTDTTQIGTTHTFNHGHNTGNFTFYMYCSFLLDGNGSGMGLYFTQTTLVNRANSAQTLLDPKYMVMFLVRGADAILTCVSVKFVCEADNKGMIVTLVAGKAYFANCTLSQWVCNSTEYGIFFARNADLYPTIPNVLFFQNVSMTNITTGAPVIGEAEGGLSKPPLQLLILKCVFQNIATTNDAAFSRVDSTDRLAFRNQSVVYCANYNQINRTVFISNSLFSNINGDAGAFASGALLFDLYNVHDRMTLMPNITTCTFERCVGRCGGAVFVLEGFQYYQKCTFSHNTYTTGDSTYGASDVSIKNYRTDSIYSFQHFLDSCSSSTPPLVVSESRGDYTRFLSSCPESDDDERKVSGGLKTQKIDLTMFIIIGGGGFMVMVIIIVGIFCVLKRRKRKETRILLDVE